MVITEDDMSSPKARRRHSLIKLHGRTCAICKHKIASDEIPTLDHIKPKALGGGNSLSNLQLAHKECNMLKAAFHKHEFFLFKFRIPFFNTYVVLYRAKPHIKAAQKRKEVFSYLPSLYN